MHREEGNFCLDTVEGRAKWFTTSFTSLVSNEDVLGFSGPELEKLTFNSDEDFSSLKKLKPSGLMTRVSYSDQRFLWYLHVPARPLLSHWDTAGERGQVSWRLTLRAITSREASQWPHTHIVTSHSWRNDFLGVTSDTRGGGAGTVQWQSDQCCQ